MRDLFGIHAFSCLDGPMPHLKEVLVDHLQASRLLARLGGDACSVCLLQRPLAPGCEAPSLKARCFGARRRIP